MPIHGQKSLNFVLYKTIIFPLTSIYWISDLPWNHTRYKEYCEQQDTVSALKNKGREAIMHRWQVISFNQNCYVLKIRNSFLSFLYASNQEYVYKNRRKRINDQANYKPVSDSVRLSVDISGCKAQGFFCWNEDRQWLSDRAFLSAVWMSLMMSLVLWWILHGWHCIITEMD